MCHHTQLICMFSLCVVWVCMVHIHTCDIYVHAYVCVHVVVCLHVLCVCMNIHSHTHVPTYCQLSISTGSISEDSIKILKGLSLYELMQVLSYHYPLNSITFFIQHLLCVRPYSYCRDELKSAGAHANATCNYNTILYEWLQHLCILVPMRAAAGHQHPADTRLNTYAL